MKKEHKNKNENLSSQERKTFEVTIERIVPGGYGIAHAVGKTIFVSLAVEGDVALVRVEKDKGAILFASIVELIQPSPLRVKPPCRYFGRCGGCDFQQMNYDAQLKAKREIIIDCLQRIAKMDSVSDLQIYSSPTEWNYRTRAQWHYDAREKLFGYYEQNSRNVCDVVECPVLIPQLQETLKSFRVLKQSNELSSDVKDFHAVASNEEVSLLPEPNFNHAKDINLKLGDFNYTFSAEVFFQTNYSLLPSLIDYAIGDARGNVALDLFCGVGLFTLPLAKRFERVFGVEFSQKSISFAKQNANHANIENISFSCLSVNDWLKENIDEIDELDFVLLDPPRAGAENKTIEALIKLEPKRITYVSCDPATLARDLKKLTNGGFILEDIAAFDLFPQTHHIETVARLYAI